MAPLAPSMVPRRSSLAAAAACSLACLLWPAAPAAALPAPPQEPLSTDGVAAPDNFVDYDDEIDERVMLQLLGVDASEADAVSAVSAVAMLSNTVSVQSISAALKLHGHDSAEVAGHAENAKSTMQAPWYAYPTTFGFITCVIIFIYGNRGFWVVLNVMAYLMALSTMKLTVKWVFVEYAFKFPKFVTVLHFISGAMVCSLILLRRRSAGGPQLAIPTWSEFFFMITPIALAVSLSIGAMNIALGFSSVAFTEIIGATTCLFTVVLVLAMGMPFDKWLLIPTAAVCMGCAVSTVGEINFSAIGMFLCFASNAFRALKVALQQKLMTGETKDKFDPVTLLLWVSVPSTIIMLVGSMLSEGLAPYQRLAAMSSSDLHGCLLAIGLSCVNAVILNLAQLFVTKDLGAVGGQLVAQAKAVLTVLGSMALFGETLTKLEMVGFAEVLIGVYVFSSMEQASKQRQAQKKKEPSEVPIIAADEKVKEEATSKLGGSVQQRAAANSAEDAA